MPSQIRGEPHRVNPSLQPLNILVFTQKGFRGAWRRSYALCKAHSSCPDVPTEGSLVGERVGTIVLFFHKDRVGLFRDSQIRLEVLQRRHCTGAPVAN